MLRQLFIIVVALILAACTSRNVREVDGVLVVDVCEVREGENIPVETLAESVEVIPLETVDGAFFEFAGTAMSESFVVVRAANGLVRIFGRDGRFVGLLEGVDERTEVYDIAIDEGRGAIYASTICGNRLLVFDLRGRRKPDIILQSCTNKAVLAADSCGIVLAQFDFTDMPSGFNAAIIGKESTRHASRPSLCTSLRNTSGTATGFNHDIFGSRKGGQLRFMTSFCDTLFLYDTKENRIVPELAVNLPVHSDINPSGSMPDSTLKERWLTITALPCHYIVHISGADAQRIIVDRKQRTAQKATITGIDSLRLYFADSYAYSFLPPNGWENCTLIRWKLSDNPNHKPAPKPDIPQSKNAPVEWDTNAALTALDLSERSNPESAMQIIDAAIAKADVKRGHPALAYAYAAKSALHTQLKQPDSANYYRQLINAPLTTIQQCHINKAMMEILLAQGRYEESQEYAIAYGVTSNMAQGSQYVLKLTENREQIESLNRKVNDDSRLLRYLLCTFAFVVTAATGTIIILRRQKKKQIAATRRELQSRMEQRIEILSAAKELSMKTTDEMRAEMMKNHAIIRRISNPSVTRPLSEGEEGLLHRITGMLYPGLNDRLQAKAVTPLNKRELTICFLFRFGVPQLSIGILLDVKVASFRTIKSHIKRDHFQLPVETELEDFIRSV